MEYKTDIKEIKLEGNAGTQATLFVLDGMEHIP